LFWAIGPRSAYNIANEVDRIWQQIEAAGRTPRAKWRRPADERGRIAADIASNYYEQVWAHKPSGRSKGNADKVFGDFVRYLESVLKLIRSPTDPDFLIRWRKSQQLAYPRLSNPNPNIPILWLKSHAALDLIPTIWPEPQTAKVPPDA
jgi:hypothetical protein